MAKSFRPPTFDVAMKLLKPTITKIKGVEKKTFPDPKDVSEVFFGSFKTYGGSENFSNGIYQIFHTAIIDTWYNPEIQPECQIYICETGEKFNIISEPENIDMRHQFMQFKVEKIGGKT